MIEFGLLTLLLLIAVVAVVIILAARLVAAVVRLVFRAIGLVLRGLTFPVRATFGGSRRRQESLRWCPRPSCALGNPVHARFCSRCGRALVADPRPHSAENAGCFRPTPSWTAR